jgi:serine/threonine protein kinase
MVNEQRGGLLIAKGSSSCVFRPNLKCKNKNTKINNKKVSKIVFGKKSKEYTNNENNINKIIKKIPGYKDWSLVFDTICKPDDFNKIKEYDMSIYDCFNDKNIEALSNKSIDEQKKVHNNESIMLIGVGAGVTLEQYFDKEMDDIQDIYELEYKFLKIMEKLKYIFIGLHTLRENQISHLDVKPNNIVLDGEYFKFIDFGISSRFKDLNNFKKRALNESNTNRIYLWYPGEFLFSQTPKTKLNKISKELESKDFAEFKINSLEYKEILEQSFKTTDNKSQRNAESHFKKLINKYSSKDWNIDLENMIKSIDVYSLGMIMPVLFYDKKITERVRHSKILIRFFSLFDLMTRQYFRDRIHIGEARVLYEGLLDKYYISDYKSFRKDRITIYNNWLRRTKKTNKKKKISKKKKKLSKKRKKLSKKRKKKLSKKRKKTE